MIEVIFTNFVFDKGIGYNDLPDKKKVSLTVTGHAGYAEKGYDIVCSAVSTLVQASISGIRLMVEEPVTVEMRGGYLKADFDLNGFSGKSLDTLLIILNVFCIGIFEIAGQYGGRLKIDFKTE